MPKKPGVHEDYIRFRLPEADKRAFEEAAEKMRISLSGWLRLAGVEKLERDGGDAPKSKAPKAPRGR